MINSINIYAYKATDAVEKGLLSAPPSSIGFTHEPSEPADSIPESARIEIENGVHQLETLLEAKIDKNFDKFEVYALRNVFAIPAELRDWVRLGHYEGLDFSALDDDREDSVKKADIITQRKKLREVEKLGVLLRAEKNRNARTIRELKTLLGLQSTDQKVKEENMADTGATDASVYPTFAFLLEKGDLTGDTTKPLSTTAEFAMSQLPPLKELLHDLSPRLKELAEGDGKAGLVGEEEKSWRRERLEFIEKETRRHLESVRGLELGEMGAPRDGEWQGEGRRMAQGEVEDLEAVIAMITGTGTSADAMNTDP